MIAKLINTIPSPMGRFWFVQFLIFASVGVMCWLTRFDYSIALSLVGAAIIVFRFLDGRGRRIPDGGEKQKFPQEPLTNFLYVGLVPLIGGMVVAFI